LPVRFGSFGGPLAFTGLLMMASLPACLHRDDADPGPIADPGAIPQIALGIDVIESYQRLAVATAIL
jgi:hypothetical protein